MNPGLKRALGFACCIYLVTGSPLPGQEERVVQPEDVVDVRGLSDVQVSADGKRVAFVVTERADPAKPQKILPVHIGNPIEPCARDSRVSRCGRRAQSCQTPLAPSLPSGGG